MQNIKLTIIIPTYNVEKYIIKALESIKNQNVDHKSFEVLIIDDASTDNSAKLINDWINVNDPNKLTYKYFYKKNGNWGSVINYAKNNNLINGQYVSILDADDFFDEKCFKEVYKIMDSNQNYDLIFSNFYKAYDDSNKLKKVSVLFEIKSKEIKKPRACVPYQIPICKFYKTKLFLELDDLREGVFYQDQILFFSLVLKSEKIYFIKKHLGYYLDQRPGSSTVAKWDENKINICCDNMNKLLSFNYRPIAGYVSIMANYYYHKAEKNIRQLVKVERKYLILLKKAKYSFLPIPLSWIAKLVFRITLIKIISNSSK
ncbi:MAG: glycosyltransferase family 2 protein [Mycoplasma sp.]|nr:glycosyltransferase family 2 protein [Mycoplasma sp.]